MADINLQRDIGDLVSLKMLSTIWAQTAGATATMTGQTIDRQAFADSMPLAIAAAVMFQATLASGKTLAYAINAQDSPDGTNWSDYNTEAGVVVATGTASGTQQGTRSRNIFLGSARRYVRFNAVPTMSNTQTDTFTAVSVGAVAGFDTLPAPASS